jgi:hypothetical protein
VEKISSAVKVLGKEAPAGKLNLTDADAPIMKGKKGNFDTNYNVQVACCEEGQIITYCDVSTDGNDKAQLVPALEGISQNTGQKVRIALADADYGTFDSFEYMDENGICGYVPYRDMNTTFGSKPFHSAQFEYDAQRDVYTCPAKHSLEFRSMKTDKKANKQYRQYRTKACKGCPFQDQCCPKKSPSRTILREVRQGLRDEMKQRLNSGTGQEMYRRRLHPIESIFGHLKHNLGYARFSLRGLEKVKAEFTLMCLAYNLRKLARFLLFWPAAATFGGLRHPDNLSCSALTENLARAAQNAAMFLRMPIYYHVKPKCIFGHPVWLHSGFASQLLRGQLLAQAQIRGDLV